MSIWPQKRGSLVNLESSPYLMKIEILQFTRVVMVWNHARRMKSFGVWTSINEGEIEILRNATIIVLMG